MGTMALPPRTGENDYQFMLFLIRKQTREVYNEPWVVKFITVIFSFYL